MKTHAPFIVASLFGAVLLAALSIGLHIGSDVQASSSPFGAAVQEWEQGGHDPSAGKRWRLRLLVLAAGLSLGLVGLRLRAEGKARRQLIVAVQRLREAGTEVSSRGLAQVTGMPEHTVRVHLPWVAITVGARTTWFREGGKRLQRLEWPAS